MVKNTSNSQTFNVSMALVLILLATPITSAVAIMPMIRNSLSNAVRRLAAGDGNIAVEKRTASLQVFALLNQYRTSLNLTNLTWSEDAYNLAKNHTIYMINQGVISHDGFDTRAAPYASANENVAMFSGGSDSTAASTFFTMWKNSPGHNANMLDTTVTYDGTSIYLINNTYYSTMFNMKPMAIVTPTNNKTTNTTTNVVSNTTNNKVANTTTNVVTNNTANTTKNVVTNTTNTTNNVVPSTTNTTKNVVSNTTNNVVTNNTTNTTNNVVTNTTINAPVEKLAIGKQIFSLLNIYRASKNLTQLTWSDTAYNLIAPHTVYMINQDAISHDGFDTRAEGFSSANENVAMFTGTDDSTAAATFMTMWENSPGHNANMLDTTVSQDAVSVYFDPASPQSYYATMFNDSP